MDDHSKTKEQLIEELAALRARLSDLKISTSAIHSSDCNQLDTVSVAPDLSQTAACNPALDVAPKRKETILLVEDEDAVRQMTREILLMQGYNVLEAASGPEALSLRSQYGGPIHLLLTDIVMPQMNGRELAARMIESNPSMKILFMSGYTGELVAPSGMSDENHAFISKPFTLNALADKLRKLLD